MISKAMNGSDGRRFLRQAEQAFGDMDSQLTAKDAEILNLKRDIKQSKAQNKAMQAVVDAAIAWRFSYWTTKDNIKLSAIVDAYKRTCLPKEEVEG